MKRRKPIPKYRQGIYKPTNIGKNINSEPIEFRSQLEFEYMHLIDKSNKVKKWGSEVIWVPYENPVKKQICQYWTDLYVETISGKKYVVEIKPEKEIRAIKNKERPKKTGRKKNSTLIYETKMYLINKSKWESAFDYCRSKGYEFITLSEKDLKNKNIPFL